MPLRIEDRLGAATTTTGTGSYTLGGLLTAHASIDAKLSVNDFFYGMVEAVDGNGAPTGDWEIGKYTKTATNVLERTEIHASSNNGEPVNWAAGTKHVKLALTAYQLRYLDQNYTPPPTGGGGTGAPPTDPVPGVPANQLSLYGALTFQDEFEGTTLDAAKWPMQKLWYEGAQYANRGNIAVSNSVLKIWAKPWASSSDPLVRYPNEGGTYKNHNATLCTDGVFWQRYGFFEARIKMPRGKGPFPAWWMYGHQDQAGVEVARRPEIDIMECYPSGTYDKAWSTNDNKPINHVCTVWADGGSQIGYRKGNDVGFWETDLSAAFHDYGVHWDATGFQFYFDKQPFGSKIMGSITDPLYLLLDYWMGGESGYPNNPLGTLIEDSTNALEVDWVRCWRLADGSTFTRGSAVKAGLFTVNLSTYGGGPAATLTANRNALASAVSAVNANGGGVIKFDAGTYDFGSFGVETTLLEVVNANNITFDGTGVTLQCNTTANVTPIFLRLPSPTNVMVKGFTFNDTGAVISGGSAVRGAQCVYVPVFQNCSGLKVHNCTVNSANIFVNYDGTSATMTNTEIKACVVNNCYYGLNAHNGFGSSATTRSVVEMTCTNVRRAVIGRNLSRMNITITMVGGTYGSNAFISPYQSDAGPCEELDITLNVSGNLSAYYNTVNGGLIHFYHQGSNTTAGMMRNINATVNVGSTTGNQPYLFCFSHESPGGIQTSTVRTWQNVTLDGSIPGGYLNRVLSSAQSTSVGNSIFVSTTVLADTSGLPSYFQSVTL